MIAEIEFKRKEMMTKLLQEIEVTRKKRYDEMEKEYEEIFEQAHHTRLIKLAET